MWEADADTLAVEFVNDRVLDLLGYEPMDLIAVPDFWSGTVVHPDDRERFLASSAEVLAAGRVAGDLSRALARPAGRVALERRAPHHRPGGPAAHPRARDRRDRDEAGRGAGARVRGAVPAPVRGLARLGHRPHRRHDRRGEPGLLRPVRLVGGRGARPAARGLHRPGVDRSWRWRVWPTARPARSSSPACTAAAPAAGTPPRARRRATTGELAPRRRPDGHHRPEGARGARPPRRQPRSADRAAQPGCVRAAARR